MAFNKTDSLRVFVIGVISSVTAVAIWQHYKRKKQSLDYGQRKIIDEIKSEINMLRSELISEK